jgi:hypothetical protein
VTAPHVHWLSAVSLPRTAEAEALPTMSMVDIIRAKAWCLIHRRLAWLEARAHEGTPAGFGVADEAAFGAWCAENVGAREEWAKIVAVDNLLVASGQRLTELCAALGLADGARFALELCVALAIDGALRGELGRLMELAGEAGLTERLLRQLAGPEGPNDFELRALADWGIVDLVAGSVPQAAPAVDPFVVAYLTDAGDSDPALAGIATVVESHPALESWPVAAVAERARCAWRSGRPFRLAVRGESGSGRRTFSASVAKALGLGALAIDTGMVEESEWARLYRRALRFALVRGYVPIWCGVHAGRRPPPVPRLVALQILSLDVGERAAGDEVDGQIDLPAPTAAERRSLWRTLIPALHGSPPEEIDRLADQFRLAIGGIAAVARRGVTTAAEARAEARKVNRELLGDLGTLLACPFARDDLRLTPELDRALDDFLFEARVRTEFWEKPAARRLFPRGRGLVGFLVGPPGTGKTMAAQVVAAELELDLYRIDIAVCLSKYIGETVKNLRQVFTAAARMNAVFLFDEADALFAKRTEVKDAHDRHANTDTNYLLQLLEDFDGVALLASNRKQNIDPAFMRRIRFILDFPRPGAQERRSIWQRMLNELAGQQVAEALGHQAAAVAEIIAMSGAQIKLALLSALFAAAQEGKPLGLPQLYRGINRELAKEGRSISPKEREQIERFAHGGAA